MSKKPLTIGQLLNKGGGALQGLLEGVQAADTTLVALKKQLPEVMSETLVAASIQKDGQELEVIVNAQAVASRLRYQLAEVHDEIGRMLKLSDDFKIKIKVMTKRAT